MAYLGFCRSASVLKSLMATYRNAPFSRVLKPQTYHCGSEHQAQQHPRCPSGSWLPAPWIDASPGMSITLVAHSESQEKAVRYQYVGFIFSWTRTPCVE